MPQTSPTSVSNKRDSYRVGFYRHGFSCSLWFGGKFYGFLFFFNSGMSGVPQLEGISRHLCSLKYKLKAVKQLSHIFFKQCKLASGLRRSSFAKYHVLWRGLVAGDPVRMIRKYPGDAWKASSLGGIGTCHHGCGAELLRLVMASRPC